MFETTIEALIDESRSRLQEWLAAQRTEAQRREVLFDIQTMEQQYGWWRNHGLKQSFYCVCRRCGRLASSAYDKYMREKIESQHLCFYCVHGDDCADRYDFTSHRHLVIGGTSFGDSGNRPYATPHDKSMMGFGGRVFTITHLQDNVTWHTNNLYCGSTILQHWRHRMPDNAVFAAEVPADTYR
jgi:hypothetical protein